MKKEALPVSKLIILYFVEKIGMGVSNAQITQFMLLYSHVDYFNLQDNIQELIMADYLTKMKQNKKTLFYITDEGTQALGFFHNKIPESAKKNVTEYLQLNSKKIQTEQNVSANYFPTENGEYIVKCALIEGGGYTLMELSITTANKDQAKNICSNWRKDTTSCYKDIMEILCKRD